MHVYHSIIKTDKKYQLPLDCYESYLVMRTWVESGLDAYRYNSSVFEWQMDKEDLVQEFGFPRELLLWWFSTYFIPLKFEAFPSMFPDKSLYLSIHI